MNTELLAALERLHDLMDDYNASRMMGGCRWCHYTSYPSYDADGLKHTDTCPLIQARQMIRKAHEQDECPLCGQPSKSAIPHQWCINHEQAQADMSSFH